MKKVPFYSNHEDGAHCSVAVYRMLFDYFLQRKVSWAEMDKMAGFTGDATPEKTAIMWERMRSQGFDIVQVEGHAPTLNDIDAMLADDRLVFLTLNLRALNGKSGYVTHAVLVLGKEGDDYVVHDPGLPPQPYRHVTADKLLLAMGGENNTAGATGVKFKPVPTRADVLLARQYPGYSRAALAKLFDKGLVTYQGKTLKPGAKLLSDVQVEADASSLTPDTGTIDLPVLYEDDDCVVINKPAGVLTHSQGKFGNEPTVATFLRRHVTDMTGERAGIVHRLDRATSGVLIGAKNPRALSYLQQQFADRKAKKTYVAIVKGHLKQEEALIDMPIERNPKAPATFRVGSNGKPAKTYYKVLAKGQTASLVELKPETGRTHQLRVHLAYLGHPIVGDPLYGGAQHFARLYLHAQSLEVSLPETHERKAFTAPLPPEFEEYLKNDR
ncbi:MAG TPA: RluA family pseudouridine synthase [Candidatus Saccharimonadales bacterium]